MKCRPIVVVLLLAAVGCTDIVYPPDRSGVAVSPTNPSPTPPSTARVEFRIVGNAVNVRVRYATPQDGLTQVITTLPFTSTFTTREESIFLSLDVTPITYSALTTFPFLSAQIFVNGTLFREATSNEFLLNTLSVSGTWRRP